MVFTTLFCFAGFGNLVSDSAPVWAYVAVTALWLIAIVSLWRASLPARQGRNRQMREALKIGGQTALDELAHQRSLRTQTLGWVLAWACSAVAAIVIAFVAIGLT
ncbi:hypothetical protein [Demequina globuliformis]|uniref:hypothetical protein n=1 Tax=Demequina globuliformis TaxID=676202 RepID=UPI000784E221|nr:hypothetical protein [Demequina globuliformis]